MNLKEIQDELLALAARSVTLANEIGKLVGEVSESQAIEPGDAVRCTGFSDDAGAAQRRCFTVGDVYQVANRMTLLEGLRVVRDDEGDGHDAIGVLFERA